MTTIDPAILDIAAVVTGEQRITLTGWQLDLAIAAMTALGHSTRHIAYSTRLTENCIRKHASRHKLPLNGHDRRPDWFAIDMVVTGAACMHLRDIDRLEAIRAMADRGLDSIEMARRLVSDPHNIRTLASRIGVRIPRDAGQGWDRIRRNRPARQQTREAVAA